MKNILIDTCSLIDLLSEKENKLLPHLVFWINNKYLNFVTHEVIIDEWNKQKKIKRENFEQSLRTKYKHTIEIGRKEKLLIPENLEPNIQNIDNQIKTIDELLNASFQLKTQDKIKVLCSDRTISKKAPFHNKINSTKDAYIIFSALEYFKELGQDFLFISANKKEFGDPDDIESKIHHELIESYTEIKVEYSSSIDKAIHNLKKELQISLQTEELDSEKPINTVDEINIDKTKFILDQVYDYISIRHKEIKFYPISLFINNYPLKGNLCYYSLFSFYTDNDELFSLFKSIEIHENKKIEINNEKLYNGVDNYIEKIKFVLLGLSNNMIFNIINNKTKERILIRYSEEESCECPKCSFRKFKFSDCFKNLNNNTKSNEDLQESSYLNYLIGNYFNAISIQKKALDEYKKQNLKTLCFICQFNLSKLSIFLRNNYYGENSHKELVNELSVIDLEYEKINFSTTENKKIIKYINEEIFYIEARNTIQQLSSKLIDQYYSSLNRGWSLNNDVWILINEFSKLEAFLSDNYIIYNKFKEFQDIFSIFIEGLFASYAIAETHQSRLNNFDDWLITLLLQYGNPEIINKFINRYKIKKIHYEKTSENGDSFYDLIDNFFNDTDIKENFDINCEKNNFGFWYYYNNIFQNILILISISDFDTLFINSFSNKLINYFKKETCIHSLSFKQINVFLYRCGEYLNKESIHAFFELGINNHFFHNLEFYNSLLNTIEIKKERINITEQQFNSIKNIAFEVCLQCDVSHQNTIIIPIYQMIDNDCYKNIIKDEIYRILKEDFSFELFYKSTLFELIPLDMSMLDKAIKISLPKDKQISFKSAFSGINENRFEMVNSILNLCFKFNIDTTKEQFNSYKSLDSYYAWLVDMNNFNYELFEGDWIDEYRTRFYSEKIYNNLLVKKKLESILKENFDSNLERNYINIYIRKTWNI